MVEGLCDFDVEGLAGAVGWVLHQGAGHGLGIGKEGELALVVRAQIFSAEVEDTCSLDLAGVGDGFAAAEAEVDEVHGWPVHGSEAREGNEGVVQRFVAMSNATVHRIMVRVNTSIGVPWHYVALKVLMR